MPNMREKRPRQGVFLTQVARDYRVAARRRLARMPPAAIAASAKSASGPEPEPVNGSAPLPDELACVVGVSFGTTGTVVAVVMVLPCPAIVVVVVS